MTRTNPVSLPEVPRPTITENLPRSGVIQFVGRQEHLQALHQRLWYDHSVKVAAITGMGGIGKTELALQYALAYRHQYTAGICWIQASSGDIGTQIVQFCRSRLQLHPSEELDRLAQVGFCWAKWPLGDALLILNDVTNYQAVTPFLPPNDPRFRVLVTTRLRLGRSIQQIELNLLSEAEAIALLTALIGSERVQAEPDAAHDLLVWLGYLPLGVEMVGRYLNRKPDLSLAEMQERLHTKSLNERSLKTSEDDMTARKGVAAAFELSWDTMPVAARRLSCLLSLFAPAPIPWALVEQCCSEMDPDDLEELVDDNLLNLHLLQRKGSRIYQLHQLVREFLKNKVALLEEADQLSGQFCNAMVETARQIPESPTRQLILQFSPAMPHVAIAAIQFSQQLDEIDFVQLFQGLGRFYEGQGFYEQAAFWANSFHHSARKRFGSEHPVVATSINNLGCVNYNQGKYAEAERLYVEALNLRKKLLNHEHLDIADGLNNLGLIYEAQGRYGEAEPLYQEALMMRRKLLSEQHSEVADSLNNLGMLYSYQQKCTEAQPLLEEALKIRKQILGNDSPRVAMSLNNLAYCYAIQEHYEVAEKLYQESLELFKQTLGEDHPQVATGFNNLAHLYAKQEKFEQAKSLFGQALEVWKRSLNEDHPLIATGLSNLAYVYDMQNYFGEAEILYQQALDMRLRALGESHPDVAYSLNNLGMLYEIQNRYENAKTFYQRALAILKLHLGNEHPHTQCIQEKLLALQAFLSNPVDEAG